MLRIALTVIITTVAWIHPLTAISAYAEPLQENPSFINYEQFHKPILGDNEQSKLAQTIPAKNNSVSESRPRIQNENSYSGRNYSKEEVQDLIRKYSAEYGIDPATPLCVAKKESGFNPLAKNKSSSASGVFQYINGTWNSTDEGRAKFSVFDADANIKAAVKYMASRKNAKPWTVAKSCPPIKTIN